MPKNNEHIRRQGDIISSIGLFYLIIIGLFAVPLMGAVIVVMIKGVLELRYAIIIGGILIISAAIFFVIRFLINKYRMIQQDRNEAGKEMKKHILRGEPVQLSVFNGIFTITYGTSRYNNQLLAHTEKNETPALLPYNNDSQTNIINQLQTLCELKDKGALTENEYETIKRRLLSEGNEM